MTAQELHKKLLQITASPVVCFHATVTEVDIATRTCTVQPPGQSEIPNVRLRAAIDGDKSGIIELPEVGSSVLVQYVGNKSDNLQLLRPSKISKIIVSNADESLKHLLEDTYAELNKTRSLINALVTIIGGAPIAEPGNGSPSALQAALSAAIAAESLGDYNSINNRVPKLFEQ